MNPIAQPVVYSNDQTANYTYYSVGAAGLYLSFSSFALPQGYLYDKPRSAWIESPSHVPAGQIVRTGDTVYLAIQIVATKWLEVDVPFSNGGNVGWGDVGSDANYEWQPYFDLNLATGESILTGIPVIFASVAQPGFYLAQYETEYITAATPDEITPLQFTFQPAS